MAVNTGAYTAQRRGIDDDYAARTATNEYARTISQQRGSRNLGDMSRSFGREQPKFTASFARRGLSGPGMQSGVFANSMQRYLGDYQRQYAQTQQDQTFEQQQFGMNQANMDAMRQRALADLEAQRQQDIAMAALNIKAIQPMIG